MSTPPDTLQRAGRRLWNAYCAEYDVEGDPHTETVLEAVAALADRRAVLQDAINRDGAIFKDRFGQPRLNPAVAEMRLTDASMASLLKGAGFGLEPLHDTPGRPAGS